MVLFAWLRSPPSSPEIRKWAHDFSCSPLLMLVQLCFVSFPTSPLAVLGQMLSCSRRDPSWSRVCLLSPALQAKAAVAAWLGEGQTATLCSHFPLEAIFGRPCEGQQDSPGWGGVCKQRDQSLVSILWSAGQSAPSGRSCQL